MRVHGEPVRLIIHPGLPKTGTTFLQQRVFGPHPQVCNIGKPFDAATKRHDLDKCCRLISQADDSLWERKKGWVHRQFQQALADRDVFDPQVHRVVLLSHEGLVNPQYETTPDEVLGRIREVFGGGFRFLVTLRKQAKWLESFYLYRFVAPAKYPEAGLGFQYWAERQAERRWSGISALRYQEWLAPWVAVAGEANSLILPFEIALKEPEVFYGETLATFLNVDGGELLRLSRQEAGVVNERRQGYQVSVAKVEALMHLARSGWLDRWLYRRLAKRLVSRLDAQGASERSRLFFTYDEALPAEERQRIASSNVRLQALCSWDLSRLGYPVEGDHRADDSE